MGRRKSSSAIGIRAALVGLASVRANVKDILKKSEIERSIVDDPEGKLSLSQITKFWEVSSNVLNDPVIGLNMAELIPFGTYQTSDFLLSNSPTLREGLGRFVKFFDLSIVFPVTPILINILKKLKKSVNPFLLQ